MKTLLVQRLYSATRSVRSAFIFQQGKNLLHRVESRVDSIQLPYWRVINPPGDKVIATHNESSSNGIFSFSSLGGDWNDQTSPRTDRPVGSFPVPVALFCLAVTQRRGDSKRRANTTRRTDPLPFAVQSKSVAQNTNTLKKKIRQHQMQ